jgi:hypothetical protein
MSSVSGYPTEFQIIHHGGAADQFGSGAAEVAFEFSEDIFCIRMIFKNYKSGLM